LPTLLAGKNVLDGGGADVDLVLVGYKFQPVGQQAKRALNIGLNVFEADDALDVRDRGALRSLRCGKLLAERRPRRRNENHHDGGQLQRPPGNFPLLARHYSIALGTSSSHPFVPFFCP